VRRHRRGARTAPVPGRDAAVHPTAGTPRVATTSTTDVDNGRRQRWKAEEDRCTPQCTRTSRQGWGAGPGDGGAGPGRWWPPARWHWRWPPAGAVTAAARTP